jgi:predicted transcriptional regulator
MTTLRLAAEIVAAFVENNRLPASELPGLLTSVHRALETVGEAPETRGETSKPTAAQIRRSIRPDALVSFLDGKPYKQLKRHLGTHGLTPAEYRLRFGLPADYPMTAPDYSARRSELAKAAGLGSKTRKGRGGQ